MIFLISGTPGSGKSSVARALMQRFKQGVHLPVDDLRKMVVSGIAHPVAQTVTVILESQGASYVA